MAAEIEAVHETLDIFCSVVLLPDCSISPESTAWARQNMSKLCKVLASDVQAAQQGIVSGVTELFRHVEGAGKLLKWFGVSDTAPTEKEPERPGAVEEQPTYVLYHTTTGMACVMKQDVLPRGIWSTFPHMKSRALKTLLSPVAKMFFHKKQFSSWEVIEKKVALLEEMMEGMMGELTDGPGTTAPVAAPKSKASERERVQAWVLSQYEISANAGPEYRMKSTQLSQKMEKDLGVLKTDSMAFRNRVSAYLLELGLQRKRLSDGFYYFGLRYRFAPQPAPLLSLEELTKRREKEQDVPLHPALLNSVEAYGSDSDSIALIDEAFPLRDAVVNRKWIESVSPYAFEVTHRHGPLAVVP